MTRRLRPLFVAALCALSTPAVSQAAILFSDTFEASSSSAWTVNAAPAANAAKQSATFGFDYSAFGIPAAPGSSDTLGLRLRANIPGTPEAPLTTRPAGATSGLSVSPTGKSFGTNYRMTFYAWGNYFGTANALGLGDSANSEGGTFNMLAAVGTSGTGPLVVGNTSAASGSTIDGIAFVTTTDGGLANSDVRAFAKSNTATTTNPVLAATGANPGESGNAYYTSLFPPVAAPAIQLTLSTAEFDEPATENPMAGMTAAGAFGFRWNKVVVEKNGGAVTWFVNDKLFATVDASSLVLGGANIALGQSDVNGSTARHPSLAFTVFDNLVVESIIPEPATGTLSIVGLAMTSLLARRKR